MRALGLLIALIFAGCSLLKSPGTDQQILSSLTSGSWSDETPCKTKRCIFSGSVSYKFLPAGKLNWAWTTPHLTSGDSGLGRWALSEGILQISITGTSTYATRDTSYKILKITKHELSVQQVETNEKYYFQHHQEF